MNPPSSPQFTGVGLSPVSSFCSSPTLMYFYFVLSPCPVPTHTWPVCPQLTQERGASQPSSCLPGQVRPAPTPQWKQQREKECSRTCPKKVITLSPPPAPPPCRAHGSQQTYRDLDADNRGKQSPHHERVKEHEPVAWDAESQTDGARCGGGAAGRDVGDGPLPLLFAHSCHPAKSQNSFC